jgi:hypothetical protein
MKLTKLESEVFSALLEHVENSHGQNGKTWGTVYLMNAKPENISLFQFAAVLSNLEQKGLYKKNWHESGSHHYFGYVLEPELAQ